MYFRYATLIPRLILTAGKKLVHCDPARCDLVHGNSPLNSIF